VSLVDTSTGEIVQMSEGDARELTDMIRRTGEIMWSQIIRAYNGRAWAALGYSTWDDYCSTEFDGARIKLPREDRREVVASLREAGMSVRAIAAATGASKNTIAADVSQIGTPEPTTTAIDFDDEIVEAEIVEVTVPKVTGVDGKSYPAKQAPPKCRRPPIASEVGRAALDLMNFAERIASIVDDERFARERDELAAPLRNQLVNAIESLQRLLNQLDPEGTNHD
jgi:transposase-like protein